MVYLGLLLFLPAVSYCFNPLKLRELDINTKSLNSCAEYNEQYLDNVFYSYFKPLPGVVITSVSEGGDNIWKRATNFEFCKYVLVAYKHKTPYLLYLLRDNPEFTLDNYYVKYESGWDQIDCYTYKQLISQLEKVRQSHSVTLFLDNSSTLASCATVHEYSNEYRVQFVAPKYGYSAWRVHLNGTIWSSKDNESRCAAVWGYRLDGFNISYVKLLIKHSDGGADLLEFYQKNKRWYRPPESGRFAAILGIEHPDSFLHPDYDFFDKVGVIHFPPFKPQTTEAEIVSSNTDPSLLYIDLSVTNEYVFTQKGHLDGVYYQVFKPRGDAMVYRIRESFLKVWNPYRGENLKLAIVAYERNIPILMYTVINVGNSSNSFYFRKKILRNNSTNSGDSNSDSSTSCESASNDNNGSVVDLRDEDYINNSCWIRTTSTYYNEKIEQLSALSHEKVENVKLDIYLPSDGSKFYFVPAQGYSYYAPKPAYKIVKVMNQLQVIWTPKDDERVIAAYVYDNGSPYLVKLVVTDNKTENAKVLSYYFLNGKFSIIKSVIPSNFYKSRNMSQTNNLTSFNSSTRNASNDSTNIVNDSTKDSTNDVNDSTNSVKESVKDDKEMEKYKLLINGQVIEVLKEHYEQVIKRLEDFYYPQYNLSPKVTEFPLSHPLDTYKSLYDFSYYKSLTTGNYSSVNTSDTINIGNTSASGSTGNCGIPSNLINDFMEGFVMPYYNKNDCMSLDIFNPDKSFVEVSTGVFDRRVNVKFIQPMPGKYFSGITERGVKMYERMSNSEAAVGVHLYSSDGVYVLADVMLASSRPASIHLKKVNDMWKYIRKQEFTKLLQQLKSVH